MTSLSARVRALVGPRWEAQRRAALARRARHRSAPDTSAFFRDVGVDRTLAERRCAEALTAACLPAPPDGSLHYLAFAALEVSGFRPRNVLELGTFRGQATAFLAELFRDAMVYTVDLPADDPIARMVRQDQFRDSETLARLDRPNIAVLRCNTMLLGALDIPEPDLVWLDAGHEYPEVAWDHAYCLSRLRPGGWLFTDDIRLPDNPWLRSRPQLGHAHQLVRYWDERQPDQFRLLPKREDPVAFGTDPKYIAYLHRRPATLAAAECEEE